MNKEELEEMLVENYLAKGINSPFNSPKTDRLKEAFGMKYRPTGDIAAKVEFDDNLFDLTWGHERHGFSVGFMAALDILKTLKEW